MDKMKELGRLMQDSSDRQQREIDRDEKRARERREERFENTTRGALDLPGIGSL